ncbi:hypothetical protein [Comamonas sp. JUb58]|uniref:hypothetical protein n=1 Tax=Comamonas sp. JUb58 TaxID=2485114 RepID=UPI001060D295|nr:hypothetical protein [Comamonas sp. JUb58]TDS70528.1 hypothetical protein EDF71_1293 [Comamonas sp. JUb58]
MIKYTPEKIAASKAAFSNAFALDVFTKRTLQSIAFHLRVNIDIGDASAGILIVEIWDQLIRKGFTPAHGYGLLGELNSGNAKSELAMEIWGLATTFNVQEESYEFLLGFSKKIIQYKLSQIRIFHPMTMAKIFESFQSPSVLIGYLCDVSGHSVDYIAGFLFAMKVSTQKFKLEWHAQLVWFKNDKNKEKLRAASYFSGKQISVGEGDLAAKPFEKTPQVFLMPPIHDIDDIELFFHRQDMSSVLKLFIFEKIRGLYNKRSSREENKRTQKNCNFTLTPEAKKMIEQIARECGVKGRGSELLNVLFQAHNKQVLQNIVKGYAMVR